VSVSDGIQLAVSEGRTLPRPLPCGHGHCPPSRQRRRPSRLRLWVRGSFNWWPATRRGPRSFPARPFVWKTPWTPLI